MGAGEPRAVLPHVADATAYFRDVHRAPDAVFAPALHAVGEVARDHGVPPQRWERSRLGRNVVFLGRDVVVKLGPPCWAPDVAREAAAVRFVADRLPVATPRVVAAGELDGWEHLITTRLPGEPLRSRWRDLTADERAGLAAVHGEVAAALHALADPPPLAFDWDRMLREQRAALVAGLTASGVPDRLVATAEAYVDGTPLPGGGRSVLTHGDVSDLNYLVTGHGLSGLVDWGDVRVGPHPLHDLISPAVHTYLGEPAVWRAFLAGYGAQADDELRREVTARVLLYYADGLGPVLRRVPGAADAADWHTVARLLTGG